jgi:hypothetical protein
MHIMEYTNTMSFSTGMLHNIMRAFYTTAYLQQKRSYMIVVTHLDALYVAEMHHKFVCDITLGALTHNALVSILPALCPFERPLCLL